jgi:arylsulfatase A-like enzyme
MLNRREFLAAGAGAAASYGRERKPNVIVVLLDDMGSHDLGCQGATDVKTPNIDSLAAGGARFTNWYSNAPMCAPSRATLMTGRYPARCGVPKNGMSLPVREQTIPALLKPAGYATGLVGKWHLGSTPDTAPNSRGFDYFYGFHSGCVDFYSHRYYWGEPRVVNYHDLWRNRTEIFEDGQYLTERLTQEAVGFIQANRSQPFFLYLAYNAVHYPMHAPKRYVERFPGLEPERQMYAAMLAAADDGVGEVLRTLDKGGIRDNTLIIFSADNGATTEARAGLSQQMATAGSNAPYRGFKFSLFDGGMHVPAIFHWPGVIQPGQVIRETAMTADLLPTICTAAGVPVPADRTIDGRDALPLMTAGAKSQHPDVFWDSDKQQAVRRGRWKLVVNGAVYDGPPESRQPLTGDDAMFLSDLEEDPGETRNLRRKHPELVDELATAISRWQETVTKD